MPAGLLGIDTPAGGLTHEDHYKTVLLGRLDQRAPH